jgi:hypothetical protein
MSTLTGTSRRTRQRTRRKNVWAYTKEGRQAQLFFD